LDQLFSRLTGRNSGGYVELVGHGEEFFALPQGGEKREQ
jgi:hypothetical protein